MTNVTFTGGEEYFTGKYADPETCTYYVYRCKYCTGFFYLVDPNILRQWVVHRQFNTEIRRQER
jgi:hypothetical protein